ncbi:MAG: DUF86 domain-containing protein [Nitrososphaeria archaeon]|nr:DUF86 domain-containing protein [Nitrososphaeria archaeon]
MSINKEYIESRVREINDAIKFLKEITSKNFSELTEYEKLAIRYLIIQLVEAASSICLHTLLNLFNEKPEGFPECFIRLGSKNLISKELATKLSLAARLRNLIVHRYWVIKDEIVYESVKSGLKDFEDFTLSVRHILEKGA